MLRTILLRLQLLCGSRKQRSVVPRYIPSLYQSKQQFCIDDPSLRVSGDFPPPPKINYSFEVFCCYSKMSCAEE